MQVVSGITVTKLLGISVLSLTRSQLLKIYFARMWLALIVAGALHGLVLLPVLLSLYGGQGYGLSGREGDGEWIERAVGTRYGVERGGFGGLGDGDADDEEEDGDAVAGR